MTIAAHVSHKELQEGRQRGISECMHNVANVIRFLILLKNIDFLDYSSSLIYSAQISI